VSRDGVRAKAGRGAEAVGASEGSAPPLPRRPGLQDGGRTAKPLPPEAHRPFLDALAEVLVSYVVSRLTAGSGPRPNRKSEAENGEAFDGDSADVQADVKGVRHGR
jgi:hypothetical protein